MSYGSFVCCAVLCWGKERKEGRREGGKPPLSLTYPSPSPAVVAARPATLSLVCVGGELGMGG